MDEKTIRNLLAKRNVVSVGYGFKKVGGVDTGRPAIVIGVSKKLPVARLRAKDIIPETIEDHPSDVVEVGEIKALAERTDKWRPAPGGVSCGHYQITAGTLGAWVNKGGHAYLLSNNHVLADVNEGQIGDPILQPGPYDGGQDPIDRIALLWNFVPISMAGLSSCKFSNFVAGTFNLLARLMKHETRLSAYKPGLLNTVDCALGKPIGPDVVDRNVLDCGVPTGVVNPTLNMEVVKSGRTTGLTQGKITQLGVTATVNMGDGRLALFTDQIMVEKAGFSAPGDSGSVVLTPTNNLFVGLLFAGSDTVTMVNKFSNVVSELGLDVSS